MNLKEYMITSENIAELLTNDLIARYKNYSIDVERVTLLTIDGSKGLVKFKMTNKKGISTRKMFEYAAKRNGKMADFEYLKV